MADNHYAYDRTGGKPGGVRLGVALEGLEKAMNGLQAELATMDQMLDGDGSQDGHYNAHVLAYGFSSTADARAARSELAALVGKLTNNASQTSVFDAIKQGMARFRS